MPDLLSISVIRDPQSLSLKEIDQKGFKSHPAKLQSRRYKKWVELCERKAYKELLVSMEEFVNGEEAITQFDQIPENLLAAIKFSAYNGYRGFDIKEFAKKIDLRKAANDFGKEFKESGIYENKSPAFALITNLSDQLLALTQVDSNRKYEFNLQAVIKALKLNEIVYLNGKEKLNINIEKHFAKPMIVESCILQIDPCTLLPRNQEPKPNSEPLPYSVSRKDETISDGQTKDNECRCKEEEKDCECKCEDTCVDQNPCCVKIRPYIAELFVVKDEICKYVPGEISYIENVMESEIRVRKHRHLQREETYSENEEEVNTYEEKNLQVEEQFSLHKEVDRVVEQSLSINAGVTYNSNSGFGSSSEGGLTIGSTKDFSASLDTSYNWSKKEARKQVQDESKNVISKAISRVEKKIRTLSTRKLINEIEEKNKHVFGGTTGAERDMSRQFYYVNQVRKAQVFSYGKRTMLDFYLPEPSELLKRLVEKQFNLKKPEKPCVNIEDIGTTKEDYLELVQCYGLSNLEMPPEQPPIKWLSIFIDETTKSPTINIPSGYTATEMHMPESNMHKRGPAAFHRFTLSFGGKKVERKFRLKDNPDTTITTPAFISERESGSIGIDTVNIKDFWAILKIKLVPDPIDYLPWQLEVYNLLMEKYQEELTAYNEALTEFEKTKENHFNKNPFILSEMMKEQLKHAAISYISCQFFDANNAMKNRVKDCGFPQMDLPESKKEGEIVRFFEQAFEWKFMNYMLYPYFWARKCSWEDKFKEESNNHLFTKFLQSGYARVSITVRPGFERLINYYLQTRKIWGQSGVPPIIGNGFVPIHQEIKESKDNFNTDRDGYLTWNSTVDKNEILLIDNLDYYSEDIDSLGNPTGTYSFEPNETKVDLNREITINCVTYRIVRITEVDSINDIVKITLDRELELDCCCTDRDKEFEDIYDGTQLPWSTGAEFIGGPWKYNVPTSLTWLREEGGCLPCYPIKCE